MDQVNYTVNQIQYYPQKRGWDRWQVSFCVRRLVWEQSPNIIKLQNVYFECLATASNRLRTCILWQIFWTYVRTVVTPILRLSAISL